MHEVTVMHKQESLQDKLDRFWKIVSFWDACSGILTEISHPVLEIWLKIQIFKVCKSPTGGGGGRNVSKVSTTTCIEPRFSTLIIHEKLGLWYFYCHGEFVATTSEILFADHVTASNLS